MIKVLPEFLCNICNQMMLEPKHLACSHKFCCGCLRIHCVKNGNGNEFPCPACQKDVKIDDGEIPLMELPDKIPTNLLIERQLEKSHFIKQRKSISQCGLCFSKWKVKEATKYCRACEEHFCGECGNQHWLLRSSKEHRVWLIEDINELKIDPYVRANLNLMFNAKVKATTKLNDPDGIDTEKCLITGASFLPDGQLLILDKANEKLKLFDRTLIFRSQEKVQGHDIQVINKSSVVVTCPELNMLTYYSVAKNEIKRESVVDTEGKCYGLASNDTNSFFTGTAGSTASILKFTKSSLLEQFDISAGKIPLSMPFYLAHCVQNGTFCVSDLSNKCIKAVSNTGGILWERNVHDCGAVISFGDYFLLGRQARRTVDIVRPDGQILKSLLTTNDGLTGVTVLTVDSWKLDISNVQIAVMGSSDLIHIYTAEDPLSELDWLEHSRGNAHQGMSSGHAKADTSSVCGIL